MVVLREDGKQYHNRVMEWFQVRKHLTWFGGTAGALVLGTAAFFVLASWQGAILKRNVELVLREKQLKTAILDLDKSLQTARDRLARSESQLSQMERLARAENLPVAPVAGVGGPVDSPLSPSAALPLDVDRRVKAIADGIADLNDQVDSVYRETEGLTKVLGPHLDDLAHTPSIWPVKGFITSAFGGRQDPFDGEPEYHQGIDISAPYGSPVAAPAAGLVIAAGWRRGLGQAIEISHGNGLSTVYGHLSKVLVKPGQEVKRNQRIGLVGSTGRSTGAHLHYEVHRGGRPVNPKRYLLF